MAKKAEVDIRLRKQDQSKAKERAVFLLNSPRGRFIIGQALYLAIEKLREITEPLQEKSNIADMEALQSIFFPYEIVVRTMVVTRKDLMKEDTNAENIGGGSLNG